MWSLQKAMSQQQTPKNHLSPHEVIKALLQVLLSLEIIEEDCVTALQILSSLLTLEHVYHQNSICKFRLGSSSTYTRVSEGSVSSNSSVEQEKESETNEDSDTESESNKKQENAHLFIILHALKGSFFTYCWNTFLRFDDEYCVLVFEHEDEVENYLEAVIRGENLPSLEFDGGKTLVHMKGFDAINKRLLNGFIDWYEVRRIQTFLRLDSIGPVAFMKIIMRMIFVSPLFAKAKQYLIPMPVTLM